MSRTLEITRREVYFPCGNTNTNCSTIYGMRENRDLNGGGKNALGHERLRVRRFCSVILVGKKIHRLFIIISTRDRGISISHRVMILGQIIIMSSIH